MKKKKIVLIVDTLNWAFYNIASLIKKELNDIADIDILAVHNEKYNDDLFKILEDVKGYDRIHFFWRKNLLDFNSEEFKIKLKNNNIDYNEYLSFFSKKITTCVADHMFLDNENINLYKDVFNKFSSKYYTISNKLFDIYSNIHEYKKPNTIIMDTFDKNLFKAHNLDRFNYSNIANREIVIGWVGNSAWNKKDGNNIDYKGLHTILKPALEDLTSSGYNIKTLFADRQIKFTPHNDMPNYYNKIDLLINCSYQEGTPLPILEAMSCGIPIISTNVGVVPQVFGKYQKNYIIGDRTILEDNIVKINLKSAIISMYNNRKIFKKLSKENLSASISFDSTKLKEKYIDFFINN